MFYYTGEKNNMNTTIEQADNLIETLGYTDMVEDYEQNELGHVYALTNGDRLVVTSATTHHYLCTSQE